MDQSNEHTVEEMLAQVSGFVQGVGFRHFVVQRALALSVRGYVRNTNEGDVEVVAQGPHLKLEQLLYQLRQGPDGSDVENVLVSWREPGEHFRSFNIRW